MKKYQTSDNEGLNCFELYEQGNYSDAERCYIQVIKATEPDHWALQDYHGEFSLVLEKIGKPDDAKEQLKKSLEAALNSSANNTDLEVTVACHFLAEFYIRYAEYKVAIALLEKYLGLGCKHEHILYSSIARAFNGVGDNSRARKMANIAISMAPDDSKENILIALTEVLSESSS